MTSPSLQALGSLPSISSSARLTGKIFPNPRCTSFHIKETGFSMKTLRCMRDSGMNLRFGSKSNAQSPEFAVSFSTATADAPSGTSVAMADKLLLLVSEFRSLAEPIDRVKRLLLYAAALPPFDESARVPANRVPGCATQVWLDVTIDEFGRMRFRADSDSEISKGFSSCLIWILDGAEPEEVLGLRSEDLAEMNVGAHGKAKSRVNTWQNVLISMQKRTMALIAAEQERPPRLGPFPPPLLVTTDGTYPKGSYMASQVPDYSVSLLPLYYDYII